MYLFFCIALIIPIKCFWKYFFQNLLKQLTIMSNHICKTENTLENLLTIWNIFYFSEKRRIISSRRANRNFSKFSKSSKKYFCTQPNCNKSFQYERSRNYHMKHWCNKPPRFMCGYCYYKAFQSSDVKRHSIRKHQNAHLYIIDLNNKSF